MALPLRKMFGLTLIELLVSLVILSILAAAALPYAELTVRRNKELELHRSLREMRNAIDSFHDDWIANKISKTMSGVSEDGFPKTLQILADGVDTGQINSPKRKYIRSIPRDPLAEASHAAEPQWQLRGYRDEPRSMWGGRDVYDIHSSSPAQALDGSYYKDW